MHKVNAGYTLLVPLKPGHVELVSTLLTELHRDPTRLPFAQSKTTFFATITVIPAQTYRDKLLPAKLLLATSFCGPTHAHIAEVVRLMGEGLRDVFKHCEGVDADCTLDELEDFILENRHGDTFYSAMNNLSPEDVRRHCELRNAIETYIDERQENGGFKGSAVEVHREIQEHVRGRQEFAWAREPWKPGWRAFFAFYWRQLLIEAGVGALLLATVLRVWFIDSTVLTVIVAVGWAALIAFLVFVAVLLIEVRLTEPEQTYTSVRPPDARARELAALQNRPVINEFTLGGPIKQNGVLRPTLVSLALWIIARGVEGVPGVPVLRDGINIPIVATARWIGTDGGRRVVFISNYTNEGVAYVRDFIETPAGAMRINLTFGFGLGFPQCEWIILRGALEDPNSYLYSLRENMLPTLFWYGPYHDIGIDNIKVNRKIREGLFEDLSEDDARKWLHLL